MLCLIVCAIVGLVRGGPLDQYMQGNWPDGFRHPDVGTIDTASQREKTGTDDTAQSFNAATHHTVTRTESTTVCHNYDTERCHDNEDHEGQYNDATPDHVDDNGIEEHDDDFGYQDHVPDDHANDYNGDYHHNEDYGGYPNYNDRCKAAE